MSRLEVNIMPKSDVRHIKGLVFDLDGTLIHSTIDFIQMRNRTFRRMKEAGVPENILDQNQSIGWNLHASIKYLTISGYLEASSAMRMDTSKIMSDVEMLKVKQTKALPGAERAVSFLINEGYPVSILTRGSRRYTEAALAASGLFSYFPHTVCRDDHPEEESKPNPISLARAAGKMGISKERCLLIGDHAIDLECAVSAGTDFVGVLSGATDRISWTKLGDIKVIPDVSFLPDLLLRQ
jgi:phosphoglycolate phosphatase-like HAD superfamily hydrolase